mmetsp:Transcript_5948/g.6828  ORF Transcript_5948/g.6828 Transcript_5948/m.6828 type:complete len:295 (-) Transcript_5948:114-998(-)|eukprot:CAMPEP_0184040078 /NCGR_PEP_ID=MMETSP0955-20130417/56001_1 /TAXON_ID=627963 /ORGANISM="Aplanochytrium sp, Strain PBS07" /LENGTH=294 /DNA_ID=CAMNT_0026329657 /DNA_START=40 /DNA_END=924 /DNA_ORIENTATION=-
MISNAEKCHNTKRVLCSRTAWFCYCTFIFALLSIILLGLTYNAVSNQKPFCDNDIDLLRAANLMEPEIGTENATIFAPVATGWNTACDTDEWNQTKAEEEFNVTLAPNDSLFRANAWTKYAYTVVQIVGWEIIDPGNGRSAEVQQLTRIAQVTFFNNPTWWREQALQFSLHYSICGWIDSNTRLILTESGTMLPQEFVADGTPTDSFAYKYDIKGEYGQLRVTLQDVTDDKFLFSGGRCAVWSEMEVPEAYVNWNAFIFTVVSLFAASILFIIISKACEKKPEKNTFYNDIELH